MHAVDAKRRKILVIKSQKVLLATQVVKTVTGGFQDESPSFFASHSRRLTRERIIAFPVVFEGVD